MRETILLRKTMAFCLLVSLTLPVSATHPVCLCATIEVRPTQNVSLSHW